MKEVVDAFNFNAKILESLFQILLINDRMTKKNAQASMTLEHYLFLF